MRFQDFEKPFAEAFPSYDSLRDLVERHFEKNLADIASQSIGLESVRLEVFKWAKATGSLGELLKAASIERPGNAALKALCQRLRELEAPDLARMPVPPAPYFAHEYQLQRHFTGRRTERSTLSGWWLDGAETVLALTAIGGMGKSSLAWAWIQQDVLGHPLDVSDEGSRTARVSPERRPAGIFWWSFYEPEARFDAFLHDLLCYVGEGAVDPALAKRPPKDWIHHLDRKPFLVVMDGFERELREYARMDASRQDDGTSPDVRGRSCTLLHVGGFLRAISSRRLATRFLLTSRLLPTELEAAAYCRPIDLRQLAEDDAVAFFKSEGVRGTESESRTLCSRYGYHPLALRLLSGAIVKHPVRGGDIGVALETQPSVDLKRREHHVLEWAYAALPEHQAELLSRIAAFRSTVAYAAVLAVSPFSTEAALQDALADLNERGFIFVDGANRRYDLHPVVRAYAYARLRDKQGTALRLVDYFGRASVPDKIDSIKDFQPLIELFHHTVDSGNLDAASRLYLDRIHKRMSVELGEVQKSVELLQRLFPAGEQALPSVDDNTQTIVRRLAAAYRALGDARKAVTILEAALARISPEEDLEAVDILTELGGAYLALGELRKAEHALDSALTRTPLWNEHLRGHIFEEQFHLALVQGQRERALALRKQMLDSWGNDAKHRFILASCDDDLEVGGDAARRKAVETLEQRASEYGAPMAFAIAKAARANFLLWRLKKKRQSPTDSDSTALGQIMTESIARATEQRDLSSERQWRHRLARWHLLRGELDLAEQEAHEALVIAERFAARRAHASMLLLLAQIAERRSDAPLAFARYEKARQLAECDGRPHCFAQALDEAEKAIARLSKPKRRH